MATRKNYPVGNVPPLVTWTIVRGDSASFRVYVTDDSKTALTISEWDIAMEVKRPNTAQTTPEMTDDASLIVALVPEAGTNDGNGEFTVTVTPSESNLLETGDIFDIELRAASGEYAGSVWTVAQGSIIMIEDVTNSGES
jgi:hypothetical protein